jgi:PiT family inorganic phosphate transporter
MAILLLALTMGLAFANGANDVSKGIATLVGSGVGSYRRAMMWGVGWTMVGAFAAALVTRGFVPMFSGRGLLAEQLTGLAFPVSVTCGAVGWLLFATRTGLPVSTTHALVGGLVGAGVIAAGPAGVRWAAVARAVGLPLALSPLLALVLVFAVLPLARFLYLRLSGYCVCLERRSIVLAPAGAGPTLGIGSALGVMAGADCPPRVLSRIDGLAAIHWLSAALTSFARAMNDAPKVFAIGIAAQVALGFTPGVLLVLVAVAMSAGSQLAGWRVTQTLGTKVTTISAAEGLAGNVVTSALVGLASTLGAPVSTTHVSTGAIVGIGIGAGEVHWKLVRGMLVAWLVTLPIAGVLAGATYAVLGPGR